MEIGELKSFCEIVRTGSYSKASKKLFITPSAVSHQIKKLEKELRTRLFQRQGNHIVLTDAGKILSEAAATCLSDLDHFRKVSEDFSECRTGHLSIAASNGIMTRKLPDVLRKFNKEFPQIKFKLISRSHSTELMSLLLNDEADLVIGPRWNKTPSSRVTFLLWRSFGRILIAAKGHPLSKKKTLLLSDIAAHPLILFGRGSGSRKAIEDAFSKEKLDYEVILEIDVLESAKEYVKSGFGVSFLHSFGLTPEERRIFWSLDVSHFFGKVDYGVYYRKNRYVTAAMGEFIKCFAPGLALQKKGGRAD
ncbi:MAG: LysR family transcriptional regulator [Thermodesulfobacteriota bacterium]